MLINFLKNTMLYNNVSFFKKKKPNVSLYKKKNSS